LILGWYWFVYDSETTINIEEYAKAIIDTTKSLDVTIVLEPGRYIMANSGIFLTRVLYEKRNGNRRFVL